MNNHTHTSSFSDPKGDADQTSPTDKLIVANEKLLVQDKERNKRAAELVIANEELAFQKIEKKKRASELVIANKELEFQNKEKERRAGELLVTNEELAFQTQEKEKREATLQQVNERYETVCRATNVAIWDWDIVRDQETWNQGFEITFGYSESKIEQAVAWRKTKIHPADYQNVARRLEMTFARKKEYWTSQYRYKCKDESYKDVIDRAYIIYKENLPVRMIGAMLDVTELVNYRRSLEKMVEERTSQLNVALQKEKEVVEMKTNFISIASHEFRTPLANISMASAYIKKYKDKLSPDEIFEKVESIEKQVKQLSYVMDDVLLSGKADSGNIRIAATYLDLTVIEKLSNEIIDSLETPIALRFLFEGSKKPFCTDESLIRNIITNLISNAVKFSAGTKEIVMEVNSTPETLRIVVMDHGIGIPAKDLDNLFRSFSRGSNVGMIPGTGLGLSIVKKAVDLLHGTIEVKSEVGLGTTVTVTLTSIQPSI